MINDQKISEFIADAYKEAALPDNRNMHLIVDLFESIRKNLDISKPYIAWEHITLDNEKFDNDYVIPKILQLKSNYFNYLYETILLENEKIFENNKNDGLAKWKLRFIEATIYFKVDLMGMLCLQKENWGIIDAEATQLYQYAIEDNWVDSYNLIIDFIKFLESKPNLLAATECVLLEIIVFQFPKNSQGQNLFLSQANVHLANAKKLQPNHLLTKRAEAEFLMNNGEIQKAKELFFQLTSENASDYVSYLFIGDCFINELEKLDENHPDKNHYLEKAEYWYNEAIRKNFIQPDGYSRLVRLYANKNYIKTKNDKFDGLLQKIELFEKYYNQNYLIDKKLADSKCFDGSWLYNSYLDIAFGWQIIEEYTKADDYFEKAKVFRKNNPAAYLAQADLRGLQNQEKENLAILNKLYDNNPKSYQTNWQLAEYFNKENNLKKAQEYYENCLEIRPLWNAYLFSFIGFMYFNNAKYEKAAQFYRKAYQYDDTQRDYVSGLADSLVELAVSADKLQKMLEAEKLFKEAVEIEKSGDKWNSLGVFYYENDRNIEAITAYENAVKIDNTDPVIIRNLADAYVKEGENEKLIDLVNKNSNINDPIIYEKIGLAYEQKAKDEKDETKKKQLNDEAEEYFKKALGLDSETSKYYNRIGIFYYNQERYEQSIENYKKALEIEPENITILNNICLSLEPLKLTADLHNYYNKIINIEPNSPSIFNKIGILYYNEAKFEKAIENFDQALKLEPTNWIYQSNIGDALKNLSKKDEAIEAYLNAIKLNDKDYFIWNELGVLYLDLAQNHKAEECFKKAIELNNEPEILKINLAIALNGIGLEYGKNVNIEEAKKYYIDASKYDPTNYIYQANIGDCLKRLDKTEEAIEAYLSAKELNKNDYNILNELGLLYINNKEFEKAEECFHESIELNKDDVIILGNTYNAIGNIHYAKFEDEKAMEFYKKAIDAYNGDIVYYKNLILVLKNLGKIDEAEEVLAKQVMLNDSFDNESKQDIKNYFDTLMDG